jgi:hypothetical protein
MAYGVNPAVKEVEAPDVAAIRNGGAVQTCGEQLRLSDHSMLPSRQSGDQNVGCAEFVGIIATNTAHPAHNRASRPPKRAPRAFRHTSMRLSFQSKQRPVSV